MPLSLVTPPQWINGECAGFAWVGQALTSCDVCGDPFWEHRYLMNLRNGRWFRELISRHDAAATRMKWIGR